MDRINENLAKEKGLILNNDYSKYYKLVDIYKYLLEYYLNSKIDFAKYEELIKNSGLYIGINDKYKSINKYLNLDYIFLINNLFVEKLSNEDIELLLSQFSPDSIDEKLINVVEKTYKDVIYDNFIKGEYQNIICKVCYGEMVPINFVDNNSLVFRIYYGKNLINVDGDEFIKLHEKQLAFFKDLISNIKKDIYEKLNVNCDILLRKDIY